MASFTFRGITFDVVDRGGSVQAKSTWAQEGARLNMTYRVDFDDRFSARDALLGNSVYVALTAQYGYISRTLPHAHEEGTDGLLPHLYCKRVDIEPYITQTPTGTTINSLYATLQCEYGPMPYNLAEDATIINPAIGGPDEATLARYISTPAPKIRPRMLTMKGRTWRWVGTGTRVADGHPLPMVDGEIVVKWHQVPRANVPWSNIYATLNKTNSNPSFAGWASASTLIFSGFGTEELTLPGHIRALNLVYTFLVKPDGANYFPDPNRGYAMYEVEAADGSGSRPFGSADYSVLFRPVPGPSI